MRPDYALFALENLPGAVAVPRIYSALLRPVLEALARECAGGIPDQQVPPDWTRERLGAPAVPVPADAVAAIEAAASSVPPAPAEPEDLMARAVAKPRRLRTMARRRAAFLYYLERCPTVIEAAARTGIDRRSAQRWYERDEAFAARWDEVVGRRRRQAVDDVVLGAGHVEVREVWFRGRKVGEYTRRDRALQLYLLKQHDAAQARTEAQRSFGAEQHEADEDDYEDGDDDFDYEGELEAAAESRSEMPLSLRLSAPEDRAALASNSNDLPDEDCDSGFAR